MARLCTLAMFAISIGLATAAVLPENPCHCESNEAGPRRMTLTPDDTNGVKVPQSAAGVKSIVIIIEALTLLLMVSVLYFVIRSMCIRKHLGISVVYVVVPAGWQTRVISGTKFNGPSAVDTKALTAPQARASEKASIGVAAFGKKPTVPAALSTQNGGPKCN